VKRYILLPILILIFSLSVWSQKLDDGIALYQKGEFARAAQVLQQILDREKTIPAAWYYLGLSLYKTENYKDSGKAFENAAKLLPQDARPLIGQSYVAISLGKAGEAQSKAEKALKLAPTDIDAHYALISAQRRQGFYKSAMETVDSALKINPQSADFYQLKVKILFSQAIADAIDGAPSSDRRRRLFDESLKVLENYPNISAATPEAQTMREELADLRLFIEKFDQLAVPPQQMEATDPPPPSVPGAMKIISKPRPSYTDAGRQNNEQGTVLSVALFSADGTVGYVLPYKGLKYGLTQQVLIVVTKVKFEPTTENGKPVSTVRRINYNFTLY
jgi:tetratricopeptide (TPR) repeat protein